MTSSGTTHEDLDRGHVIRGPSDRSFGITFAVVFALIAFWPVLQASGPRTWALVTAGAFLCVSVVRPHLLAPLNWVWLRIGLLLHGVVSPLVLGVVFVVTVVPTGIVMRLLGKQPLRLDFDPGTPSYWIERDPPGPPPEGMDNQF